MAAKEFWDDEYNFPPGRYAGQDDRPVIPEKWWGSIKIRIYVKEKHVSDFNCSAELEPSIHSKQSLLGTGSLDLGFKMDPTKIIGSEEWEGNLNVGIINDNE